MNIANITRFPAALLHGAARPKRKGPKPNETGTGCRETPQAIADAVVREDRRRLAEGECINCGMPLCSDEYAICVDCRLPKVG